MPQQFSVAIDCATAISGLGGTAVMAASRPLGYAHPGTCCLADRVFARFDPRRGFLIRYARVYPGIAPRWAVRLNWPYAHLIIGGRP